MNFGLKLSAYQIFLMTRIFSLSVRPLFLAVLMYIGFEDFSIFYALAITITQGSLFLLNSEAHREFYKFNFGENSSQYIKAKYFNFYRGVFFNHIKVAFFPVAFLCYYVMGDKVIAFFMIFSCLMEKIYDELQRYQIYNKNYILWSKIALLKLVLPLIIVFPFAFLSEIVASYLYLFFHAVFIVISAFLCGVLKSKYIHFNMVLAKYWKELVKNRFQLVFYSLLVSNSLYLDRLYVGKLHFDLIDGYLLLCNISVVFVIVYDYFYLTKMKPVLVKKSGDPFLYIFNKYNFLFLFGSLSISLVACFSMVKFNYSAEYFSPIFIFLLIASYCIYNFFSPLIQYVYWHKNINILLCIEVVVLLGYLYGLNTLEKIDDLSLIFLIYMLCRGFSHLIYMSYGRLRQ